MPPPLLPPTEAMLPWRTRFCKQADQGASGRSKTQSRCLLKDWRIQHLRKDLIGVAVPAGIIENGMLPRLQL